MARINIQVDLKENEILEKQLKEEYRGIARGMAREAIKEQLESEIERLIQLKLADTKKGEYYSSIVHNITKVVSMRISDDIKLDTEKIEEIITAKVEQYMDNKMKPYGGFDKFITSYINKSIAEALKK